MFILCESCLCVSVYVCEDVFMIPTHLSVWLFIKTKKRWWYEVVHVVNRVCEVWFNIYLIYLHLVRRVHIHTVLCRSFDPQSDLLNFTSTSLTIFVSLRQRQLWPHNVFGLYVHLQHFRRISYVFFPQYLLHIKLCLQEQGSLTAFVLLI